MRRPSLSVRGGDRTAPQRVAAVDVRKAITFCLRLEAPVLGVVENMSGFVCPRCSEVTHILCSGAGRRMSEEMDVPFLGSVPLDPGIAHAGDSGQAFVQDSPDAPAAKIIQKIAELLLALGERRISNGVRLSAGSREI